jgi:SAM-dependent methyltransferase
MLLSIGTSGIVVGMTDETPSSLRPDPQMPTFDREFWEERYRSHDAVWSGNPNLHLVEQTDGLPTGTALDVGCGEGGDAIERAAASAARCGADVAARIEWLHEDVASWDPGVACYDLVSAQYFHLPTEPRIALFRRLARAVGPGGTLLVVGHHPSDMHTTMPRPPMPELFFTGDDVAASLDPRHWAIVTNTAAARTATDPEGHTVNIHDAVLRAERLPEE